MIKVLFTGGSGLIGRNVLPELREKYLLFSPSREQLNLLDTNAVEKYVKEGDFDIIIHSANPNPVKNEHDEQSNMMADALKCFINFFRVRQYCKRLYFIGSGAEFDKSLDMHLINESEFDRSIPKDIYGFSKYLMNVISQGGNNVYNLRLFACYGPTDHESKFISHCVNSILNEKDITIRQNCYFDYIHTKDLSHILSYFIENKPKYHDYNIASGDRKTLLDIANEVIKVMESKKKIIIMNPGFNKEYTPCIDRLREEIDGYEFMPLSEGIKTIIPYELEEIKNVKKSS